MPELPEVETVRRGLEVAFKDKPQIVGIKLYRADLRFPMPRGLDAKLRGAHILAVRRRAKYLLIDTDRGTLLSHLGMTGSWRINSVNNGSTNQCSNEDSWLAKPDLHRHVDIVLQDGRTLVFRDPRRFGMLDFISTQKAEHAHVRLKDLGPEPFAAEFNAEYLFKISRKRTPAVKVFLMDQKTVVGVGNIYASEALFRAGVKPQRKAGKVTQAEYAALVTAARGVLEEAIGAGGSSISDFVHTEGAEGNFQNRFQVYDREGEPCLRCATPLKAGVTGGRSTYWCPRCQR